MAGMSAGHNDRRSPCEYLSVEYASSERRIGPPPLAMKNESTPLPPRRHAERHTEQRNSDTSRIDRASVDDALRMLHAQDRLCLAASESVAAQVEEAIGLVVEALSAGGRLIYVGAGTSGRLGVLDASEQPPTFGVPPEMVQGIIAGGRDALTRSIEGAEDNPKDGERAIVEAGVGRNDVVMGIAAGGRTPYVLGALRQARAAGARTIFLSCTPPLDGEHELADCQIHPLVGPEPITGSTRMKAGTVTKLILNQITTLAMVQLGKVFENLMVDLKPTNGKLLDRAARILGDVAGLEPDSAALRLSEAGNDLKTAIVMSLAGSSADQARETLDQYNGHVARAIRSISNE